MWCVCVCVCVRVCVCACVSVCVCVCLCYIDTCKRDYAHSNDIKLTKIYIFTQIFGLNFAYRIMYNLNIVQSKEITYSHCSLCMLHYFKYEIRMTYTIRPIFAHALLFKYEAYFVATGNMQFETISIDLLDLVVLLYIM